MKAGITDRPPAHVSQRASHLPFLFSFVSHHLSTFSILSERHRENHPEGLKNILIYRRSWMSPHSKHHLSHSRVYTKTIHTFTFILSDDNCRLHLRHYKILLSWRGNKYIKTLMFMSWALFNCAFNNSLCERKLYLNLK